MPRRWRIVWLLTVAALLMAALAAVPALYLSERFYRFQEIPLWAPPLCWIATAALLVLVPKLGWRRTRAWLVPAAVLALAVLPVLPLMMLSAIASGDSKVVAVEVSSDGRHDAVTQYVDFGIDTLCAVRLRERRGLFSRQTDVWPAREGRGQQCPTQVSFTGNNTISIIDARGLEMTTHFDADRMQVAQLLPPP
ncbi:hypothetical protein [Nocardia sp. NPDC052316]|uniref:hypothetical protein n=1 Tax=Nocardia sp. NPDC052316 TaxID=3364329 RepID=UPI0037C5FD77